MKRLSLLVLIILFFIAGFLLRNYFQPTSLPQQNIAERKLRVTKVLDGDTIIIETGDHVRYEGQAAKSPGMG